MTDTLRLLAVLAHPDDESLGFGGTFAKYAQEGVETFLVTATRGERGRYRGHREGEHYPGRERVAVIREEELRAAAATLGIREVSLLEYPDQEVDRADTREAIDRVAGHIRRLRPHVVMTFGPDGVYGHPDHIAIAQFTTAATVVAGTSGGTGGQAHAVSKLYYMAWSETVWTLYQQAFTTLGSQVDGVQRSAVAWPDWAITTIVDARDYWEIVWRAVSCHESQVTTYERLKTLTPEDHQTIWGRQCFYRVFSTVNGGRARETDLFEGLR
jgi:LmbE family N-acetylglucosaminyl deacetylase